MASAKECNVNPTDLLIEKLEKLAAVPPACIDKALKYTINACGIDCEVTASSAFEAATKFAIWAKEVCGLQDSITNNPRYGRHGKGSLYLSTCFRA